MSTSPIHNYCDTAFTQLAFAWKLYNYALEGRIDLEELDKPLSFEDGQAIFVLPDRVLSTLDDLVLALENGTSMAFGAAAIALNRHREDAGVKLANPIIEEIDQFVAVVYQIRNAFAHDITVPKWNLTNSRYARAYMFGGIKIELSNVATKNFKYSDVGGPDVLFRMKEYGDKNVWA